VTRIIGGTLGSMRLKTAAKATRPTSDRVKESIFSILESMDVLENARVLDLFAGTGALGLEAVSRGASIAVFVEKNREAASVCRENVDLARERLKKTGSNVTLELVPKPAEAYLAQAKGFDLVFVDPPYDMSDDHLNGILVKLFGQSKVKTVVVERSSKTAALEVKGAKSRVIKNYGDTTVYFFVRCDAQQARRKPAEGVQFLWLDQNSAHASGQSNQEGDPSRIVE
jgi:16S rRNA (guanine966-N2)-methyltransferase